MASPDDLIITSQILTQIRKADLPGLDRAKLDQRKYKHVYDLIAAGRIPAELDGRLYKVRRRHIPDVAVGLGVMAEAPPKPARAKRAIPSSSIAATA